MCQSKDIDKQKCAEVHEHGHTHDHGCKNERGSGDCCHHGHGHSHEHNHNHEHGHGVWLGPVCSGVLLLAGIILNHLGLAWFQQPVVNLLWFLLAFLPVALPVFKEGWEALKDRDFFNEFTLMIIASIGAFCIKEYPEAVAVMLFYTVGETLQHGAVDRATRNIGKLLDVRPERALLVRDGKIESVAPADVKVGDEIEVRPGERVPLDGVLLGKESSFDTSALTGESVPRNVEPGGEVLAGMIASESVVRMRVTRPYDQSALSRILELVKDASSRKAPAEKFIRRFARVYTPLVIILACLVVALPALFVDHYVFSEWLYRGLVFLVISCPCALVISVPLGYFAGIGAASRAGILFKGGNYLDAITKVDTVAFDKTGTLTTGSFEVRKVLVDGVSEAELVSLVMGVESKSSHPIAKAVMRYGEGKGLSPAFTNELKEISGHGAEGLVDGRQVVVGNLKLMDSLGVKCPEELRNESSTLVICARDRKYIGALMLSDELKPDAAAAIEALKKLGIEDIHLLSGDKPEVVARYAAELGIKDAWGGLLPADKAEHIEELINEKHRNVAFVGDGMNDAPVLALSNVGVAMGGLGSDAAVESADVVIQDDRPSKLVTAIRIGRYTRKIVSENIFWAIVVKVAVLAAGALGYVSLWAAVFADVGVSLLAVLNSLRIMYKRFGDGKP